MSEPRTYEEWKEAALRSDRASGRESWRRVDHSQRYDYKTIRFRLEELREIKASGDPHRLLFYVKEGVHGNMGGMASSSLYGHARFGTKDLITDYIRELAGALETIAAAEESEITVAEKVELFERAGTCYGRSALMFSGAGSLGPFHLGVARALLEQDLLPKVLSGASAGAFVSAIIGTHSDADLHALLLSDDLGQLFSSQPQAGKPGSQITTEHLREMVHSLVPDLTFEEAFDLTGRRINISVSPSEVFQQSRLLNAVTSPNVCIREAVLASCAIPGVFPAVTLAAKDVHGVRQPYIRSRTWIDGSITDDQPVKRLARLYQVNHFISSQANPIVLWSLRDTGWKDTLGGRIWDVYQQAGKNWFRATYPFAMKLTQNAYPLNVLTRYGYGVATQDYTADVNILPSQKLWAPSKLLAVLTDDETMSLVREGERATWPKIEMLRNAMLVSRTLDRILDRIHGGVEEMLLRESSQAEGLSPN